jgi:thiamine kinase-like enzyme
VVAVDAGPPRATLVSTVTALRVEYSPDAPAESRARLFLKPSMDRLDPDLQPVIGEREVAFYRHAAPLMPAGSIPRCYDAEFAGGRFHLLLEDLSETHAIITPWPLPPTEEACERIIDAWAAFHAFWWRHPSLGKDVGAFLDDAAMAKLTVEYRERFARFAGALGDRFPPAALAIYARVNAVRDQLITPARLYANYTIVHGDAHVWNLLYPKDAAAGGIRLIDWDNWRIGRAAADRAYMMAVHWDPERRARLEALFLDRYHAGLCARGVTGYSLERLWEDYRLSVIGHLSIPVWQQTLGIPAAIWWSHLHRVVAAFEDLDCAFLLE